MIFRPGGDASIWTKKKKLFFQSKENSHRMVSPRQLSHLPPSEEWAGIRWRRRVFSSGTTSAHPIGRALSVRFPRENGCHPIGLLCLHPRGQRVVCLQVYLAAATSELTSHGGRRGADAEGAADFSLGNGSAHRSETRCVTSDVTEAT
jgi:hypothetical protein